MINNIKIIIAFIYINFLFSITISGIVSEKKSGAPLIGANIYIEGTEYGSATNTDGFYQITFDKNDLNGNSLILIARFIGFETEYLNININHFGKNEIDFILSIDPIGVESVVIIGYGKQKKGELSTSISSINNESIEDQPVASIDMAIQGKLSGVNVSNSSGQPGAAPKVQIRGATSITASCKPLYVIDGIPMVSENNSALFTGGYSFNSLSDLNPSDIKSIDVLKDASAAAIYGSRGANGVIQITTKRGIKGGRVTFESYSGVQKPTHVIPMMNSKEFIEMMNEAAENDGLPSEYFSASGPEWNRIGDPNDPNLVNTDWYGQVLRDNAPIRNLSMSALGGSDKVKYYINGTQFVQEGIQRGTEFDRISFRVNTDAVINDKLSVGANIFSSRSNSISTIGDNSYYGVMINTLAADPTMPVFEEDGSYAHPFSYYSWWALENPVAAADEYNRTTTANRLNSSIFSNYKILDNLSLKSTLSMDYSFLKDNMYYPSITNASMSNGLTGIGLYANSESLTWLTENVLTYNTNLGEDNKLNTVLVYSTQENNRNTAQIDAVNYSQDNLGAIDLASEITNGSTMGTSWGMASLVGRASLNHKNKYYLSTSLRRDGSSRFGEDKRYGLFPSISFAWRLTEEEFIPEFDFNPDFKFRLSYGQTGNQDGIHNFASQSLWTVGADYNGAPGINPIQMGNSDLEWETTTQTNVGMDLSLLNGRFSTTVDFFNKLTTGLLMDSYVPGFTGFSTVTRNIGEIKNSGMEISFHSINFDNGLMSWETDINVSTINNEIVKLTQDNQPIATNILKEGYPLGAFYLIHWEGVDPETGNSMYTDQNGDGVINSGDMVAIKDKTPWPDHFGGINNKFTYGNFDMNVFFQYSVGNYVFNHSRYTQEQVGWSFNYGGFFIPYGNNTKRVVEERWQNPGDDTNIPRASLGWEFDEDGNVIGPNQPNWMEDCDQWLEDASYLRLKTFELGYNLKSDYFEKFGISDARIYFVGQNLWTLTKYLGMDPEVSSNGENPLRAGEDYGGLGQAKTYYFGIRLGV
jgi:TonB-dependent starch-binding outer membrane protein SusC